VKNTSGLGSERELAADRLFDLGAGAAIILYQVVYGFPSFVTFGYDTGHYSRS
jgi:hypothetical protein